MGLLGSPCGPRGGVVGPFGGPLGRPRGVSILVVPLPVLIITTFLLIIIHIIHLPLPVLLIIPITIGWSLRKLCIGHLCGGNKTITITIAVCARSVGSFIPSYAQARKVSS